MTIEYRIRAGGAVVTDSEFRTTIHPTKLLPAVLTAAMLDGLGADPVLPAPAPATNATQTAVRNGVVKDANNNWVYAWKVNSLPAEQIAAQLASDIATFIKAIDADADAIYADVVGGRALEYQRAEEDAQSFKDAGYTGNVPDGVSTWATAKSWTPKAAADDILAVAIAWRTAQTAIRGNRLAKKEQARASANPAALASVRANWSAFVSGIRTQLGV